VLEERLQPQAYEGRDQHYAKGIFEQEDNYVFGQQMRSLDKKWQSQEGVGMTLDKLEERDIEEDDISSEKSPQFRFKEESKEHMIIPKINERYSKQINVLS